MDFTLWRRQPPECPSDLPDLLAELTAVGAPTGAEARRVDFIERWLRQEAGLRGERDRLHNLVYDLSGGVDGVFLLDAHTDTVFAEKKLQVKKDGEYWRAPGIYDNTLACVQLMLMLRCLTQAGVKLPFMVSFSVCEEGTGDLRGIREILDRYGNRLTEVCAFDMGLNRVTTKAVGSARWKIRFLAPGGHSWGDFGAPSAVHAAAKWMAGLAGKFPWKKQENSYNIGIVRGGTGVNAIAEETEVLLDLRSIDADELQRRARAVEREWEAFAAQEGVRIEAEKIGFRPAGKVPAGAKVPAAIRWAVESLGMQVVESAGSNNSNAVLARGIPASCTGLGQGGKVHTRDEYLELASATVGWRKLCLIVSKLVEEVIPKRKN